MKTNVTLIVVNGGGGGTMQSIAPTANTFSQLPSYGQAGTKKILKIHMNKSKYFLVCLFFSVSDGGRYGHDADRVWWLLDIQLCNRRWSFEGLLVKETKWRFPIGWRVELSIFYYYYFFDSRANRALRNRSTSFAFCGLLSPIVAMCASRFFVSQLRFCCCCFRVF